jgi:hypothetical protein
MTSTSTRRAVLAALVTGIGLIHLLDLPGKWDETRWMGIAYLGLIASTIVVTELLVRTDAAVTYLMTAGLAAGPMIGFVLTRTTGLPGATDDIGNWSEPLGLASLFTEAMAVVLCAGALASRPRTTVSRHGVVTPVRAGDATIPSQPTRATHPTDTPVDHV